jgi:hypothetical protein
MAQHKASNTKTLRSALRHKRAADMWLDGVINDIQQQGAAVLAKIAADTDLTWDTDYVATHGTGTLDADVGLTGQHKATFRQILRNSLAHKKLADTVCDILEETSVSFNAVLMQMDADAGTLSDDATYEAYRIADEDLIGDGSGILGGQHKASSLRSLESALSHKALAAKLIADMAEVQDLVNAMIDAIQAKNA